MAQKRLLNFLQLAYTPISNNDFNDVKNNPQIKSYINSGKIYMITQRAILTFEKLNLNSSDFLNPTLTFEIQQQGRAEVLSCKMPLFQNSLGTNKKNKIDIKFTLSIPNLKKKMRLSHLISLLILY